MGLEKTGGEVLATVGFGSNPSISRKKCALGEYPSKAVRAEAGPVYLCVLQPCYQGYPAKCSLLTIPMPTMDSMLDSVLMCSHLTLTAGL